MTSLRGWFRRYISWPFLLAAGLILSSTLIQICEDFSTSENARDYSVQYSQELIGIGLRQHNRVLVEAALDSTAWQINSLWAVLCLKDTIWVASHISGSQCPILPNKWYSNLSLIVSDIPGFSGYQIRMAVPRIPLSSQTVYLCLISLILVFIFAVTIRTTRNRLVQDIFLPLQNGLESSNAPKIKELYEIKILLKEAEEAKTRESVTKALIQAGQQVAHDIKSPLAALRAVLGDEKVADDSRALLKGAIDRIDTMLKELSSGTKKQYEKLTSNKAISAQNLLNNLILEKRVEYKNKNNITFKIINNSADFELPPQIEPHNLLRVLSNLINNSVEASPEGGNVVIILNKNNETISIEIRDCGIGIPPYIIPKLMQRGTSFGKEAGTGLGLYHAKSMLETWGGQMEITSVELKGTSVKMSIPWNASV